MGDEDDDDDDEDTGVEEDKAVEAPREVLPFAIEDAYGESPPPPTFLETPMWPKVGLELGRAIGPRGPRIGLESLRGTRGGGRGRGGE